MPEMRRDNPHDHLFSAMWVARPPPLWRDRCLFRNFKISAQTLPSGHLSNALPGIHFPSCLEKVLLLNSRPFLNTNNQVNNTLWILDSRYRVEVNDDSHEAAVKQVRNSMAQFQACVRGFYLCLALVSRQASPEF